MQVLSFVCFSSQFRQWSDHAIYDYQQIKAISARSHLILMYVVFSVTTSIALSISSLLHTAQ
ncbi:hypothetical protein EWB00_007462 [Schistosoma japonicum]|uniref:Uncharacterized protein n=1 Tax=Schistosoma japonicum TaxID=6182 RepID=A0A4Z2CV54_SCHJA|nr:hypothetical protein EWB00_007462 [Schistosoma japonicum]